MPSQVDTVLDFIHSHTITTYIYIYICIYIPLNYTIMYKTGALLRPQHFSEFHKCWTNGVRKSRAADGGAGQPWLLAEPGCRTVVNWGQNT